MPRAQRGSPTPDRHERGVQVLDQARHAREDLGIPREVDAAIPPPRRTRPHRPVPRSALAGRRGRPAPPARRRRRSRAACRVPVRPPPGRGAGASARHRAQRRSSPRGRAAAATGGRGGRDAGARSTRRRACRGSAGCGARRGRCDDARAQHGIGEQPGSRELEQHRGVAEPGEPFRRHPGWTKRCHPTSARSD